MIQPLARQGNVVEFDDGTKVDVFGLAREWARFQDRLHGDECMNPYCDQLATMDAMLWGVHVGRICSRCSSVPMVEVPR